MKVLIAEDDSVSRNILKTILERLGCEVEVATDGESALKALEDENSPRLAIIDWMMPGLDGIEVCRRVRAQQDRPYTYIIMLTARTQKSDMIHGLEAGVDDYVTKPYDMAVLKARLRAGERILALQNQLILEREGFRLQALTDPLTGCESRASILETLYTEIARAGRSRESVAVFMADVDHFKAVNDTHGHPAGDEVLREVARRLRTTLRSYDSIGRVGGEEFLIVATVISPAPAMDLAGRLHSSVTSTPIQTQKGPIAVTISMGVAVSNGGETGADTLVKAADDALYRSKRGGRNRVEEAVGIRPPG